MRRREHYWSLFHKPEKRQLNDLRTDQVEAVFAALPHKQHSEWVIWKEGFSSWKSFTEFPQLLIGLRDIKESVAVPAPPSFEQEKSVVFGESTIRKEGVGHLALDDDYDNEGRHVSRYQKKLTVQILGQGQSFKTHTVNISMTGLQVVDPLPNGLPGYFTVEIRHESFVVGLVCSEIKSKDGSPSRRLRIEVNDNPAQLQALLLM